MNEREAREQQLMSRTMVLADHARRYLERACGVTPAEIDLVAAGMLARAARRQPTPEARMLELQAVVRRWVRQG